MCIIPMIVGLVATIVLVTLGYIALWTANHENTQKGLAGFGKVMAIILFVFAGLTLLAGAGASHMCMWHMNQGGTGSCAMGSCGMCGKWMGGHHMTGMMNEKEEMEEHEHMGMGEGNEAMTKDMMVAHLKMMKEKNPDLFNQSMTEVNKPEKKK